MSILTEDSLEFSKTHISKYFDSDFFPRPMEFEALWHNWAEVKQELTGRNVKKFQVMPPRIFAAKKPKGGYRIVHQLDPLDALVYTALAYQIAPAIEAARTPVEQFVACSYRIEIDQGSFFAKGSGYREFDNKSEELGVSNEFLLNTDITDYYSQIYLHRVNNAIEFADKNLKEIGDDLEWFITILNNKSSQGIPVGPAASIIVAEAVMIDIDQFIRSRGVFHTRYVDDFRIFSSSKKALEKLLEGLTVYLYENHRLTIATEKTTIRESAAFIEQQLHSRYSSERLEITKRLEFFNPYSEEMEEYDIDSETGKAFLEEGLLEVFNQIVGLRYLDLGLGRNLIRAAKQNEMIQLVVPILKNFAFFTPIVNDVVLYFLAVRTDEIESDLVNGLKEICQSDVVDNGLVRFWLEWYISGVPSLLKHSELHQFVSSGANIQNQARAAIQTKNLSWVREKKGAIYNMGNWERRAILFASQILPSDERIHWLKMTIGSTPFLIDKWVAKYVLETS